MNVDHVHTLGDDQRADSSSARRSYTASPCMAKPSK
jgi:hypothetical protein